MIQHIYRQSELGTGVVGCQIKYETLFGNSHLTRTEQLCVCRWLLGPQSLGSQDLPIERNDIYSLGC